MYPIYEQGKRQGIGHSFDSFIRRFTEICKEKSSTGEKKAFALILYNFRDQAIREVLKSQGGFALLDRLSGDKLSIFYLDSSNEEHYKSFNQNFKKVFSISDYYLPPVVLFFTIQDGDFKVVSTVKLEESDIKFAFHELYELIRSQVESSNENTTKSEPPKRYIKIIDNISNITLGAFIEFLVTIILQNIGRNI
jgi:hypothetical protein